MVIKWLNKWGLTQWWTWGFGVGWPGFLSKSKIRERSVEVERMLARSQNVSLHFLLSAILTTTIMGRASNRHAVEWNPPVCSCVVHVCCGGVICVTMCGTEKESIHLLDLCCGQQGSLWVIKGWIREMRGDKKAHDSFSTERRSGQQSEAKVKANKYSFTHDALGSSVLTLAAHQLLSLSAFHLSQVWNI